MLLASPVTEVIGDAERPIRVLELLSWACIAFSCLPVLIPVKLVPLGTCRLAAY